MGGACARMGPLSGRGRPDIFALHEDRLYIFASDSCRATFLANADRMVERADPRPEPSPESSARAEDLLDRAAAAMGGNEALGGVRGVRLSFEREEESGGVKNRVRKSLNVNLPSRVRVDESWNESGRATMADGARGRTESSSGADALHRQQVEEVRALAWRWPIVVVARRGDPGFVATVVGEGRVQETPVVLIDAWIDGRTTTLGVDPVSGRVLSAAWRGRGPKLKLGRVERRFSDFTGVGGVIVPLRYEERFDGEAVDVRWRMPFEFEINPANPPEFFGGHAGG